MAARRIAVGAQVTILAVSYGGQSVVWILKLSSISLTRSAGTMIIDATCSAPGSLQSCKEREGARARKGGEAKRRSSPHTGAHAREYASISVYLTVFIHILDTNGGVEDQRCSLFSPRVKSVKEREGARARKGGEAKRSPKAVAERVCKKTASGSK